MAEIARLAASGDAQERLLSLYLRLELDGPTPAILATAATDTSPWIASQAAEWLYFNSRFDQWRDYVQDVRAAWTQGKTDQIIASFSANSTGSPELSAGLVILQLGRALPDLVGALLKAAPEIRSTLETALLDPTTAPAARAALLDTFQETRPAGYIAILEKLIASHSEDSPVRFKAFVNYASVIDATVGLAWLESIVAATTPADPLGFRFAVTKRLLTEKAAAPVAQTRADTRDQIAEAVSLATSLRSLSKVDSRAIRHYVEQFRDYAPEPVDAPVLDRIAYLLESEPHSDYSARSLIAHIRALAAQPNN